MKQPYMVTVCLARLLGIKTIHDIFPSSFQAAAVFKKHRFFLVCPFSASKLSYNFLKIDQELLNRARFINASYKVEAHSFLKTFLIFTKYQPRLSYSDFLIKKLSL